MRIFVAIATLGRPTVVARSVEYLGRQQRAPDGIVCAATSAADVAGIGQDERIEFIYSERGLCRQRNNALRHIGDRADIIVFLDDDFIAAPSYLREIEQLFERRPDAVGATGCVIADGACGTGLGFEEAVSLVEQDSYAADAPDHIAEALYGCNMAIRVAAAEGLTFDEALPLYGWLEDIDFTYRLGKRGPLIAAERLRGVHMGVKGGRTSGVKLGYSQVANPIYMLRKRSAPPRLVFEMIVRNLGANLVRTPRPEAHVDRGGRLRGNLLALADLCTARLDPRRILELK